MIWRMLKLGRAGAIQRRKQTVGYNRQQEHSVHSSVFALQFMLSLSVFCSEVIFIPALRFLASSREEIGDTLFPGKGALNPPQTSISLAISRGCTLPPGRLLPCACLHPAPPNPTGRKTTHQHPEEHVCAARPGNSSITVLEMTRSPGEETASKSGSSEKNETDSLCREGCC